MIPLDYLTSEERFIFITIKEDISLCNTVEQLQLLEDKLDVLLTRAIERY